MMEQKLPAEQMVKDYLASNGWDIVYKLNVSRAAEFKDGGGQVHEQLVEAFINNLDWQINITFDRNFEQIAERTVSETGLGISNPAEKIVKFAIKHEMGHWEHCPGDTEYKEMILEAISQGLKKGGLSEDQIREKTGEVECMFSDIIVNGTNILRDLDGSFTEGGATFYAFQAIKSQSQDMLKKLVQNKQYEDYFAIFVDAQMKLVQGNDVARNLAKSYSKDYGVVGKESQRVLEAMIGKDLAQKVFENRLSEQERLDAARLLKKEERWRQMATEFGQIMAKYVKNQSNSDMRKMVHQAPQTKIRETDEQKRREVIRQGIGKGGEMLYADKYEVMDETYKQAAERIVVEFMRGTGEIPRTSIFNMAIRRLGDKEAPTGDIAWSRTIFTGNGKRPWLFKKEMPYDIDTPGSSETGSFEDIIFMLDTSGSMHWSGVALDKSKYDISLRAVYSVIKYLEETGKAPYINYGLVQFGNPESTTWSGWKSYYELDSLKAQLFTGYQNANHTILEGDKINDALLTRKQGFLAIMNTDGEIENLGEAQSACKEVINKGNDFAVLQIASRSEFASFMGANGAMVFNIDNPEDLVGLTLSIVRSKYSGQQEQASKPAEESAKSGREDLLQARRIQETRTKMKQ